MTARLFFMRAGLIFILLTGLFTSVQVASASPISKTPDQKTAAPLGANPYSTIVTVNTTSDNTNYDGFCSLREALSYTNGTPINLNCGASSGSPYLINVPAGTYILTMGELQVGLNGNVTVTITGAGAANTIIKQSDGCIVSKYMRVLSLDYNYMGNTIVNISGVTISNGAAQEYGGGGILGGGIGDVLNLSDSVISNNCTSTHGANTDGAGIAWGADGILNISNTVFSDNNAGDKQGGAIFFSTNSATSSALNITGSTFVNNTTSSNLGSGAAISIENFGTDTNLSINGSTFINNRSTGNNSIGGAIFLDKGTLNLGNSSSNRFYGNYTNLGASAVGIVQGNLNGANNWWGCNSGPSSSACDGVTVGIGNKVISPWVVLHTTATPATVVSGQATTLTASVLQNSSGGSLAPSQISALVGLPITWANASGGSFSNSQATLEANGTATTTFTHNGVACNNSSGQAKIDSIPNGDVNSTAIISVVCSPEINLTQGATILADGGSFNFGSQTFHSNTDIVFTIANSGASSLTLTTPITLAGANADQFSVQSQPTSPVTPTGSTTFTVRFTPTSAGLKTASLAIANNDSDENPYNIELQGTGTCASALTVTNANTSGSGSLNQAIADLCSGGTITFDGDYTIPITGLTPAKSLTMDGSGHAVTLSGGLLINPGETTVLNGLALSGHGSGGGSALGIINHGTLTINRCTVSNYWWSIDPANLINPGAIYNTGALTINQSTLSDNNSSERGGAVYNSGTFSLYQSTLIRNQATYAGGAIYNAPSSVLTIARSTLGQNQATLQEGGAIYNDGTLSLTNSTIAQNSASNAGGLYLNGNTELLNTLIANNSPYQLFDAYSVSHSAGNLIDTGAGNSLLAPLGNYGGPTQTYAVLPGSAAINDAAVTYCLGSDQRGVGYVSACDIGAFESQGFTLAQNSGDNQSAMINTSFTNPLVVSVTANAPIEPVNGGKVTFTAPSSGASAILTTSPTTISGGESSVTASANGTSGGPYPVQASISSSDSTYFSLTNLAQPTLSINDVTLAEGNSGTTTATFAVSLSSPAGPGGVTFDISTADSTAYTADNDYVAKSLTGQTLPAGSSTYSFDVTINGDTTVEPDETFTVNLSHLSGATMNDGQGVGTIQDDDHVYASIGNRVFLDDGAGGGIKKNGKMDGGETPIANVRVELYHDADVNGIPDAGLVGFDLTDALGFYLFDHLDEGSYLVMIPAGNFSASFDPDGDGPQSAEPGVLFLKWSSTPTGSENEDALGNPNMPFIDGDDNGINNNRPELHGILSGTVTLQNLGEPLGETPLSNQTDPGTPLNKQNNPTGWDGAQSMGRNGEVDGSSNLTIDFGFYEKPADSSAPVVDGFTVPAVSTSFAIPITLFTATDDIGVTGYLISTTNTPPAPDAAGWADTAPSSYTVAADGAYTLYPWAKDESGKVSSVYASPASVTVNTVTKKSTTSLLTVTELPHLFGQSWKLSVIVSAASGTPEGSVTFKDGTTVLQTVSLSNGAATLDIPSFPYGQHTLTAEYLGSSNYYGSLSDPVAILVNLYGFLPIIYK